jgi:hypothetical protein
MPSVRGVGLHKPVVFGLSLGGSLVARRAIQTDPKAQALVETAAEVLIGLAKAFKDFEAQHEGAWKASAAG